MATILTQMTPAARALLATLAQEADSCEHSWSIGAAEITPRVLFFCDASVGSAGLIARTARALGVPDAVIAAWSHALRGADAICLALHLDGRSVRLYTQYWDLLVARVRAGDTGPFTLYRGFKVLPDGAQRVDDYTCLPLAPAALFWPPMAAAIIAAGLDPAAANAALSDLDDTTAIFTRTDANGRQSWLTTVRRAAPAQAAVARWLEPLGQRPGGAALIAQARAHDLVHLAGGQDATKGDFLTIYLAGTPATVAASLHL